MPSRFANLAIDARDQRAVVDFWCAVLDRTVVDTDGPGVAVADRDGAAPGIDVVRVGEAETVKNRLHIDLRADGVDRAVALDRLPALGARRVDVGQPADVTWTVLADPDGNEFCLL